MQFRLSWMVAALAATVAALPTALDSVPAELDAREACRLDSFNGVTHRNEIRPRCKWYVCGQNGVWREVRDCGLDSTCHSQATSCKDRFGTLY